MTPFTLVLPYYRNASMLQAQQRAWAAFDPALKPYLHAIIVDDGSPKFAARASDLIETGLASVRLYRTLVDVRWNWLFCRNLGVAEATTDWVLLTDIDHVLPETTLRALVTETLEPDVVYRFSRVDAPNYTPYKSHPNSWFLTRAMFDAIGGYDERFSGFYGTDAEFRDRVQKTARAIVMRDNVLIRYPREVIPDASTTTYGRKEEQDRENVRRIREERAHTPGWKPLRLTFPWERLA